MVATSKTETPAVTPSTATDLRFTVPRKELAKTLATLARIADRKSTMTVLGNVAMRAFADGITLVATDLNVWLTRHESSWGSGMGGVLVNAKSVTDIVKGLSGPEVTLAQSGNAGLRVESDGVDTTLLGGHERDFPKVPTLASDRFVRCDGEILAGMLESVLYAVCRDETRFHLNGVFLESTDAHMRMVSTDGHRLTLAQVDGIKTDWRIPAGVIVPAKAARELAKLLKAEKGACYIGKHEHMLFVRRGTWEMAIKTIDAQFPPYTQVIPKENAKLATIERKLLIAALKRAKALTCETRGARLDLASGKLTITSDHPDTGTASESLKAESQYADNGGTFRIGVNPSYLLEALEAIECDHVTMAVDDELDPILVRGTECAVSYPVLASPLLAVIMPMRI